MRSAGRCEASSARGCATSSATPYQRTMVAMTAISNFFGQVVFSILLVYAVRELGLTAGTIGIVLAIGNLGTLAAALTAKRIGDRLGVGRTILLASCLFGPGTLLIALAPQDNAIPFILASMIVIGFGGILYNVTAISLIQAITPDRILGRANASRRFVVWGVVPLGGFTGGALASRSGSARRWSSAPSAACSRSCRSLLAAPLRRPDVGARASVLPDRLGEQRASVAPPGEVRLRPQPRQPVAHRRQSLRVGGEPGERVLEPVARRLVVEVVGHRRNGAAVQIELAAGIAAGREQQLRAAGRSLHLLRIEVDVTPGEPGEAK